MGHPWLGISQGDLNLGQGIIDLFTYYKPLSKPKCGLLAA